MTEGWLGQRCIALNIMAASAAIMFTTAPTAAENWPARPVTMVIPTAAGSSTDLMGRILAPRLSEHLGQQVVVENIGGAGGMIGTHRVATAAPDGYKFVLGGPGTHAINQTLYKNPRYNAATEFVPSVLIAELPLVLVARKDLPVSNIRDFIAYSASNGSKIRYGSPGVGSVNHLACALINAASGNKGTHIPYRGGGPAMQDLIAGLTDYQCPMSTIAIPQIVAGSLNAIATLSHDRSPILPTLSSAHEQGLTGFDISTWNAFFLPKGTPAAIAQKLHDATVAFMDSPVLRDQIREVGANFVAPERRSSQYLQRFVAREIDKWAAAIRDADISAE
jgi:tripartite-type tricarboxylate transporter receptor subunit TctC